MTDTLPGRCLLPARHAQQIQQNSTRLALPDA
jgi:hypothetical protein